MVSAIFENLSKIPGYVYCRFALATINARSPIPIVKALKTSIMKRLNYVITASFNPTPNAALDGVPENLESRDMDYPGLLREGDEI